MSILMFSKIYLLFHLLTYNKEDVVKSMAINLYSVRFNLWIVRKGFVSVIKTNHNKIFIFIYLLISYLMWTQLLVHIPLVSQLSLFMWFPLETSIRTRPILVSGTQPISKVRWRKALVTSQSNTCLGECHRQRRVWRHIGSAFDRWSVSLHSDNVLSYYINIKYDPEGRSVSRVKRRRSRIGGIPMSAEMPTGVQID